MFHAPQQGHRREEEEEGSRRKAVPSAPNEVTPDKEDEPEEEQPFDDDLIEQALGKVEDITIEKLIDVGVMVGIQMFRLSNQERVRGGRCSRSDRFEV